MSGKHAISGKLSDPLVICTLLAIALAVGTSVMLRIVGAGPAAAHAADVRPSPDSPDPQPMNDE